MMMHHLLTILTTHLTLTVLTGDDEPCYYEGSDKVQKQLRSHHTGQQTCSRLSESDEIYIMQAFVATDEEMKNN